MTTATVTANSLRTVSRKYEWCARFSTEAQHRALAIYLQEYHLANRQERLNLLSRVFGKPIATTKDLTRGEIGVILTLAYKPVWDERLHACLQAELDAMRVLEGQPS